MNTNNLKNRICIFATAFALLMTGCTTDLYNPEPSVPDPTPKPEPTPGDSIFDFATENTYVLNVKYDVPEGYQVFFEVYVENPITLDEYEQEVKKDIQPIDKGFTDELGAYSHKIKVPAFAKSLYIYSTYFGVPRLLEAKIEGDILQDAKVLEMTETRSASSLRSEAYQTIAPGFNIHNILGSWTNGTVSIEGKSYLVKGRPDYVLPQQLPVSADVYKLINQVLPEGGNNIQYAQGNVVDIQVSELANVDLYLLNGSTSANSVLGYYCYETANPPTRIQDVQDKIVIALPHAKPITGVNSGGALRPGEGIRLHYFKDGKDQGDEIPAGISIGWVIYNNGYRKALSGSPVNKGEGSNNYSTPSFNNNKIGKIASFRWDDFVIFGFEDWNDQDHNDLVFHVESNPIKAVVNPDVPNVKPEEKPDETYDVTYRGTLAFEDLWPTQGDFDMNDVVINYESTVTSNKSNQVVQSVDKFTFLWSGATFHNGFSYQLNASKSDVEVTGALLDPDLVKATIRLFDDALMHSPGEEFMVTTTYKRQYGKDEFTFPPYNPFINNSSRNREVHLTNYPPTSMVNLKELGQGDDRSNPEDNKYYITYIPDGTQLPFAIHIVGNPDPEKDIPFVIPRESHRIDSYYPGFINWVKTKGEQDQDWFLHPAGEQPEVPAEK